MKFTVCVPAWRPTTVVHTIESIRTQTWSDWELLIVGQGSNPDLPAAGARAQALDSRIRYIHLSQQGTCRARNAGLRAGTGDVVAMIDDDCVASPDWLETLVSLFQRYPHVGFISGPLIPPRVSWWRLESCLSFVPAAEMLYDPASGQPFPPVRKQDTGGIWAASEREAGVLPGEEMSEPADAKLPPPVREWMIGANCAVRRSVVEAAGVFFDECLGPGTTFPCAEDIDFFMRLVRARVAMLTTPAPVVYHTYGTRRGVRQILRTSRNYARGNAGLDAKLALAGDPQGKPQASQVLRRGLKSAMRSRKLQQIPLIVAYWWHYRPAYRQCLRKFSLGDDGMLSPICTTG